MLQARLEADRFLVQLLGASEVVDFPLIGEAVVDKYHVAAALAASRGAADLACEAAAYSRLGNVYLRVGAQGRAGGPSFCTAGGAFVEGGREATHPRLGNVYL